MSRIPIVVLRHPREFLPKCSLSPLHGRPDITFLLATADFRLDATGMTLLQVDAEPLSEADRGRPLLLLDSTWRLLPRLVRRLTGAFVPRSIPGDVLTAYPRKSSVTPDPERGLASVEALYVAKRVMGEDDRTLLDGYHWREQFLAQFGGKGTNPRG
jgi:pre-rRNA-processing protein TSR3